MTSPTTLLFANGSLAPAATAALRRIATALAVRIGNPVEPASLFRTNAGAAATLELAMQHGLEAGRTDFALVPLFLGPSDALTDYLPQRIAHLRRNYPAMHVRLSQPVFAPDDDRLAHILADHVRAALTPGFVRGEPVHVALVDHGSPLRAVTAVCDRLAARLATLLGDAVADIAPCSMQRRPGAEFAFTGPLLGTRLAEPPWNAGPVVVAMQFLLPGRHAGPAGDVAQLCLRAEAAAPGLRTRPTPLLGEHPLLVDILADRWRQGLACDETRLPFPHSTTVPAAERTRANSTCAADKAGLA